MKKSNYKSEEFFEFMKTLRHTIHQEPELGFEETKTAEIVSQILKEAGIQIFEGIGKTGLVAKIKKGKSKKNIGLRAELDALAIQEQNSFSHRSQASGKMHACGHDGHTAMLLGAALYLKKYGNFDGTVYFIFQPNEEHGLGALAMIEEGLFQRFPMDSIFAIHNMPAIPTGEFAIQAGPVMASEDNFEIKVIGKAGHAAMPERAIDPIVIASQVVLGLQSIISRNLDPKEQGVVSVTDFNSNGTTNVIPGQVTLKGDVRSFSTTTQDLVERKIREISEGICRAHGAKAEVFYKRSFIPTVNTEKETKLAYEAAQSLKDQVKIHKKTGPFMTSEDFGYMLQQKPGCYLFIGNSGPNLHNPHYDFNDSNLCLGSDFWIALSENILK